MDEAERDARLLDADALLADWPAVRLMPKTLGASSAACGAACHCRTRPACASTALA